MQATEAVEGDVAENLALLLPHLHQVASRPEWLSQIADWKARLPFNYDRGTPDGFIKPQLVIEQLSNLTAHMKDRTIITTGVSIRCLSFVIVSPKCLLGWATSNVDCAALQVSQ